MTVAVSISTVADAIAGLSISGVTVKDIDQISVSRAVGAATLAPRPDRFVTDLSVEAETFGSGATRSATLRYTLNYVYYHCLVGSTLDFGSYSAMITNISAVLVALITNDDVTGATDNTMPTISDIGPVSDPVGNVYHGCTVSLQIVQYIN